MTPEPRRLLLSLVLGLAFTAVLTGCRTLPSEDCPDCARQAYHLAFFGSQRAPIDTLESDSLWIRISSGSGTKARKAAQASATECIACQSLFRNAELISDRRVIDSQGDTLPAGANLLDSGIVADTLFEGRYEFPIHPIVKLEAGTHTFRHRADIGTRRIEAKGTLVVPAGRGFQSRPVP